MSGKYLLDTNAIINILKTDSGDYDLSGKEFFLSIISEIELLSYPHLTEEEDIQIRNLLKKMNVINIDFVIKEKTIQLKKKYDIKLPDAVICATALSMGLLLITDDLTLFRISEIKISSLNDLKFL
jgi:predicted nucleic acid-binding protein